MTDDAHRAAVTPHVLLSGGGSGGHVFPALAVGDELGRRGWRVSFAGDPSGMEAELVAARGVEFVPLAARPVVGRSAPERVRSAAVLARSARRAVGLITNQAGVDGLLRTAIERFKDEPAIKLVALYGPEHGVRGNAQAGEYVPYYLDGKYGVPVFSLYGQSLKPDPGMIRNIDAYMRSFDTRDSGKIPEASMVGDIDVLLYDMQDVGTRVYTYVATMAYAMQACAEAGVEFIVLDRPYPVNGLDLEGPVLEYPEYSSFVGLYPIPQRFGIRTSLRISRAAHGVTMVLLFWIYRLLPAGPLYLAGIVIALGLILYEHSLVRENDLSKLNIAFFNMNGYISVTIFIFTLLDVLV